MHAPMIYVCMYIPVGMSVGERVSRFEVWYSTLGTTMKEYYEPEMNRFCIPTHTLVPDSRRYCGGGGSAVLLVLEVIVWNPTILVFTGGVVCVCYI
jgi:hypothetical protein